MHHHSSLVVSFPNLASCNRPNPPSLRRGGYEFLAGPEGIVGVTLYFGSDGNGFLVIVPSL